MSYATQQKIVHLGFKKQYDGAGKEDLELCSISGNTWYLCEHEEQAIWTSVLSVLHPNPDQNIQ